MLSLKDLYIQNWISVSDLPFMIKIDAQSFNRPWSEEEFRACLAEKKTIGNTIRFNGKVIGFVIFSLYKTRIEVLNIAVAPEYREQGVGGQLILHLKSKLIYHRTSIVLECRESNVTVQTFLRGHGFIATKTNYKAYEDPIEDQYVMVYSIGKDLI